MAETLVRIRATQRSNASRGDDRAIRNLAARHRDRRRWARRDLARARRGDDVVALKRLHSHLVRNDEVRAQFAIEQRLTTQLPRHPGVVHAVEAGTTAGRPYIALELAPGEDLRQTLDPPPPPGGGNELARAAPARIVLPRARVLAIVIAACDAAAHLHHHGFAHGDINPGNLVVSTSDHVR